MIYHFYQKEQNLKVEKFLANLYDKTEYVIHIKTLRLKASMKSWLILKHVLRVVKFNQKLWLKPYIDMNTNLRQRAKNYF